MTQIEFLEAHNKVVASNNGSEVIAIMSNNTLVDFLFGISAELTINDSNVARFCGVEIQIQTEYQDLVLDDGKIYFVVKR